MTGLDIAEQFSGARGGRGRPCDRPQAVGLSSPVSWLRHVSCWSCDLEDAGADATWSRMTIHGSICGVAAGHLPGYPTMGLHDRVEGTFIDEIVGRLGAAVTR